MCRVGAMVLAACLCGMPLAACSRGEPPPEVDFKATRAVKETLDPEAARLAAQEECTEEARRKGIASVTRILMFRGKISKSDYIECMEQKGYAAPEDEG